MADTQRGTPLEWSAPPETELRRLKTMVEDEMMIKLGAKKETIEFHPLILAQRAERARTSFDLDYRRVKPPFQEEKPPNRNPWGNSDLALRQMSNLSRQGPRKLQLPSLPTHKAVKRVYVPLEDEEFKKLRGLRLLKRDEILAEWSALQDQAFTLRRLSHLTLPDIEPLRKYSSASLFSINSPIQKSKASESKKAKPTPVPFTSVPPTGNPKSRWRGMARQLLWNTKAAQMRIPEELPRSEVRVYISCTEDLSEEREFLAEVAYPELKKFCEKQGLGCHVVDLRHGTSRLKNSRETFDVIQRELFKCQKYSIGPCFVSLVGREADDGELPGWLSKEDMLAIRSVLVKSEDEDAVEALDNLYRLDSNYQPPIYLLEESFFFTEVEETAILHRVLPDVLTQLREEGKMDVEDPAYYPWSSTVREIELGLLSCPEPKRQTVCLMARAGDADTTNTGTKKANTNTSTKKANTATNTGTKKANTNTNTSRSTSAASSIPSEYTACTGNEGADRLRADIVDCYNRMGSKNNLILFNMGKKTVAYLREVCTLFLSAVTRLIERQIRHHEFDVTHHLTHAADVVQHVTIARQLYSNFLGGESVVNGIGEQLRDPTKLQPLVVAGPEGAGKTSLTSLIAAALPRMNPLRKVVFRILGLTLSSSSLFHLLGSLYHQVAFLYDLDPWLPVDMTLQGALQAFRDLLYEVRDRMLQKGPLTIVLDGIDRVPDVVPKHLSFLIGSLPQGITLVVSLLDSGPLFDTVKSCAGVEVVTCPSFTPERTEMYVRAFLSRRDRVLTSDQVRAILRELSGEHVPLLARIAATMASQWPSNTLNDNMDISCDMESAFHRFVESCEVQLGYRFTRYIFSLLVASRYGLADFEILHIISTDSDLIDEIKEEAEDLSVLEGYPYQMQLSRLLRRLEPFLHEVKTEGETILKVSHETLKYVVRERFMTDSFKHHIHSRLATFFQFTRRGSLLSSRDIVEGNHRELSRYLWRTLRSVPYHLCHSHPEPEEAWKKLKSEVFMKFSWIINEIYAGFFNDFIDDMNYALETLGLDSGIMFFRQFLSGVRQAVIFNPVSLASLMAGQDMKEIEGAQRSVLEAQEWLKQVHLQVLVPASYTTPKASQLQLNPTLATAVKSVVVDSTNERVILQYDTYLSSLSHATGEETTLVSLPQSIASCHLWGNAMLTVVTSSPQTKNLVLQTYAIDKGRHVKSTTLRDSPISWLHVNSDGVAFFASGAHIKKVQLEKGLVTDQCKTNEEIVDVCMSDDRFSKLVTLHTSPNPCLHVFDPRYPNVQGTVGLQKAVITQLCKPLSMTKDCAHAVVVCDRSLLLVDLHVQRLRCALDFNNVPVSLTAFSRSHEHVFVVTPTGLVRCFKLSNGAAVMEATIRKKEEQKPQQLAVRTSPKGRRSASPGRSRTPTAPSAGTLQGRPDGRSDRSENVSELVTTLVTSEDDHFVLAGTSQGRVFMLHVPTGLEVCVISSGQSSLREITYFTNLSWFQSIVTVDAAGLAKLWNLRPLVTRARTLIMDIITDKDLLNEEETKLDLGLYFTHFQYRRHDRMFLNGPDVSSFYKKSPPAQLFRPVQGLDPALQTPESWMSTGRLGDCVDVSALSAGSELSEFLVTVTRQGDVARWSLHDGSLLSVQPCPCPLEADGVVESVRPVFYDQAVCVVVREGNDRSTAAVQYAEDKKKRPLVLQEVTRTYSNTNGSLIVNVCAGNGAELTLVYWNLVTGQELTRITLSAERSVTKHASALTFSNDLSACALLVPEGKDEYTLYVWTLTLKVEEAEKEIEDRSDVQSQRPGRPTSGHSERDSSMSDSGKKRAKDFDLRELKLHICPTAVTFALNDAILLGTSSGLALVIATKTLCVTSALTAEGVVPVSDQPLTTTGAWNRLSPAHTSGIKKMACAVGSHVITSTDDKTLCVWNLLQKRLLVRVLLKEEEFVHYVLSRDCRVLTFVTSGGVIAVWGVNERKQLCTFRLQPAVTALVMTPDCRRLAVLRDDEMTSRVRVFDVRNIDDIKMTASGHEQQRKESVESRDQSMDEESTEL